MALEIFQVLDSLFQANLYALVADAFAFYGRQSALVDADAVSTMAAGAVTVREVCCGGRW